MATNDELKTLLLAVQEDVKFTKTNVSTMTEDIKALKETEKDILSELKVCKRKCISLEEKNVQLETKVSVLEKTLKILENKSREKNVILFNIEDPKTDNLNLLERVKTIFTEAKINIPDDGIEKIFRLGKNIGSRPILVAFTSVKYKSILFSKISELRSLDISIANDLTNEQRETRKILKNLQVKLTQQGKTSIIKGSRLLIENTLYDIPTIQKIFEKGEPMEAYHSDSEDSNISTNSNISTISTASKKRGRPPKAMSTRKLQRTQGEPSIKPFLPKGKQTIEQKAVTQNA